MKQLILIIISAIVFLGCEADQESGTNLSQGDTTSRINSNEVEKTIAKLKKQYSKEIPFYDENFLCKQRKQHPKFCLKKALAHRFLPNFFFDHIEKFSKLKA